MGSLEALWVLGAPPWNQEPWWLDMAMPLHLCLLVHLAPGHMWARVPAALASLDETFQASSPYQRKQTGWLR